MADEDIPINKMKIKSEDDFTLKEEDHSHKFILQLKQEQYDIHCDRPQTVLEAITSKPELQKKIKGSEDKVILQKGEADKGTAIATHFPCVFLKDKELVTLEMTNKQVESRAEGRDDTIDLKERYSFIYIGTKGGTNTTSKKLFKSTAIEKYTQLCVYGTDSMTLKDAIERDGRFEELGHFKLEGVEGKTINVFPRDLIRLHDGKKFRISLPRGTPQKAEKSAAKERGETVSQKTDEAASWARGAVGTGVAGPSSAHQAGPSSAHITNWVTISVVLEKAKTKQDAGSGEEVEKIYKLLRAQFPELKTILESRFPGDTLKKKLKKVDFGKAQQTFSEVGRVKKLFNMGESVCIIRKNDTWMGTGFVLFQRYVLTNAHLFDGVMYNNNSVRPDLGITAMFNYEEKHDFSYKFKVNNKFIDYDRELDYAVLELVVSEENKSLVPPGLMKHCCPMPESGEACIIGHPNGEVKMFDPTCIIEIENRENKAEKYLEQFKDNKWALTSVIDHIEKQGIKRIVSPLDPLYNTATYHTFMLHGSSGSPVFDSHYKVFGMHTGGFTYDLPTKGSVIEYARPVLLIFHQFVKNLKTIKNTDPIKYNELLKAVEEELEGHLYETEIRTGQKPREEPMDTS